MPHVDLARHRDLLVEEVLPRHGALGRRGMQRRDHPAVTLYVEDAIAARR